MQFLTVALPLALAGGALANPLVARGGDACLAAVTGKAALGDDSLRAEHCQSYLHTIVTPAAITVTTTVTGAASSTKAAWKRDVTVCPNEVPNYASACNTAAYSSACSVFGYNKCDTTTLPPNTITSTIYVGSVCATATATVTGTVVSGSTCPPAKTVTSAQATVTVTVPTSGSIVTKTVTADGSVATPEATCLTQEKVDYFVNAFIDFLTHTSYAGSSTAAPGSGYDQALSDKVINAAFQDYSDSINWMAGFPLGGVTFASKAAFDYGQGVLQPEVASVTTLNTWYSCKTITWRWSLVPFIGAPNAVQGINVMEISDDLTKLVKNYAEFDNAAWLNNYGVACKIPSSNSTSSSKRAVAVKLNA